MTSEDWWQVGCRLLGVYFVLIGALTATGALMMLRVGLPEGTQKSIVVLTPLIQGIISAGAGVWLPRGSASRTDLQQQDVSGRHAGATFRRAIQLLGIFFFIAGASELAKTALDSYFVGPDWQLRASSVAYGVVNTSAGALLVWMPATITEKLDRVRRLASVGRGFHKPFHMARSGMEKDRLE